MSRNEKGEKKRGLFQQSAQRDRPLAEGKEQGQQAAVNKHQTAQWSAAGSNLPDKKTTSTAKKLNRSWMLRTLLILLAINILLAVSVAVVWCYQAERQFGVLGEITGRYFTWTAPNPWGIPDTITYHFTLRGAGSQQVFAGEFFGLCKKVCSMMAVVELLLWLGMYRPGLRRARQLLQPLDEMAWQARQISVAGSVGVAGAATVGAAAMDGIIDTNQMHTLEHAISQISPVTQDRLDTGDRELQGLEQAINDLLLRMQEAYRQQARFVSDASHELRTPIAVLQGYVDMLDRWGKDDPQVLEESITAIRSEVANMKQLVEQLLFLARGESGRTQLEVVEFSLTDMIQEVYEESLMIDDTHQYRYEPGPRVLVTGDPAMLKQTARILVDNAAKYTPAGYTVTLRTFEKPEGIPCFLVQDNGIGIASGDLPHIFERFFRSDPARGRGSGGTGLGLSIAKWIVDRHGGYFELLSREAIGTRITVCLPRRTVPPPMPESI